MSPETWRGSRPRAYGNRKEQPWRSIYVWDSRMPPLYEVMRPAFRVLRVFGLAPYVLSKDGSSARMRVCNVYCLHSLISACVYFDCTYRLLKIYENMHLELSTGASIIIYEMFLNVFVVTSDLVLDIARRGRIVNLCNRLANFDTALGILWKSPPRILRKRLIGFIIANILIWSVIVDLSARSFKDTYLNMIRHTIIYLATAVGIFKFCGAMLLLEQRFGQLNNLALRDGPNIFAEKIEILYGQLMDISEELNDMYSWSLFLFIFDLFSHIVTNTYFILVFLNFRYVDILITLGLLMWIVIYLVLLLILLVACHAVMLKANHFPQILMDWRRRNNRQNKYLNTRTTLHYLNRKLMLTAGGCFHVHLPLITASLSHISTYIVILLQIPNN